LVYLLINRNSRRIIVKPFGPRLLRNVCLKHGKPRVQSVHFDGGPCECEWLIYAVFTRPFCDSISYLTRFISVRICLSDLWTCPRS